MHQTVFLSTAMTTTRTEELITPSPTTDLVVTTYMTEPITKMTFQLAIVLVISTKGLPVKIASTAAKTPPGKKGWEECEFLFLDNISYITNEVVEEVIIIMINDV